MKSLIAFLIFPCLCYSQQKTDSSRLSKDEMYAHKEVENALLKPGICFLGDSLIPDTEMAFKYAEIILFKLYGEGQIISERPYHIYKYRNFWYIDGTLKEENGGTFEIIFSSINGQIIRFCHGK